MCCPISRIAALLDSTQGSNLLYRPSADSLQYFFLFRKKEENLLNKKKERPPGGRINKMRIKGNSSRSSTSKCLVPMLFCRLFSADWLIVGTSGDEAPDAARSRTHITHSTQHTAPTPRLYTDGFGDVIQSLQGRKNTEKSYIDKVF